jgi:hypothetical protein
VKYKIAAWAAMPAWDGDKSGYMGPSFKTRAEAEAFMTHRTARYRLILLADRPINYQDRHGLFVDHAMIRIAGDNALSLSEAIALGLLPVQSVPFGG